MNDIAMGILMWTAPGLLAGIYNAIDCYRSFPEARMPWKGEVALGAALIAWQTLMGPIAVMQALELKASQRRKW